MSVRDGVDDRGHEEGLAEILREAAEADPDGVFIIRRDRGVSAMSPSASATSDASIGENTDCPDTVTYREALHGMMSMAMRLSAAGILPGDRIGIDLQNGMDFIFLLLAADHLHVTLMVLNHRLSSSEKMARLASCDVAELIDRRWLSEHPASDIWQPATSAGGPTGCGAPLAVMFTSGTTGRSKPVALSVANLIGSARAGNVRLAYRQGCIWQLVLPLYHVGGLQVVVRTLVAHATLILYASFAPELLLEDVRTFHPTHISTVDAMLVRLLDIDRGALVGYKAILNAGGPIRRDLLERCRGLSLYVSYGSTETCSQAATSPASEYLERGLEPLDGYRFTIVHPDRSGSGQIAVMGPGVFSGYLDGADDGTESFSSDGFFLTGDTGRLVGGRLIVDERLSDLFISGGENIYPAEVERALLELPGIREASVIGVEDRRWGRVPQAFLVGDKPLVQSEWEEALKERLGRFEMPHETMWVSALPTTALGKVDRGCLYRWAAARPMRVKRVHARRIMQPLVRPFVTAKVDLRKRESIILQVFDEDGHEGIGECVSFPEPWYVAETLGRDEEVLRDILVPHVLETAYRRPEEVAPDLLAVCESNHAGSLPMAVAALEMALWDLYGNMTETSLRELIGGVKDEVKAGVVLGIMPIDETVASVDDLVKAGMRRVKLKIAPEDDVARVRAVRDAFPDLLLMADANRSYDFGRIEDIAALHELDHLGLLCMEEPFGDVGLGELERFQRTMGTPVCLDESIATPEGLREALRHPGLKWLNMKIGLLGGIGPALDLYRHAMASGMTLWMGGMYETGVSKRAHALLETLPGITIPGDLSDFSRYFAHDVCDPPFVVADGLISLPDMPGLGIILDERQMEKVTVEEWNV